MYMYLGFTYIEMDPHNITSYRPYTCTYVYCALDIHPLYQYTGIHPLELVTETRLPLAYMYMYVPRFTQ